MERASRSNAEDRLDANLLHLPSMDTEELMTIINDFARMLHLAIDLNRGQSRSSGLNVARELLILVTS